MSQDSHLQEAVLAALKWEPSVTAAHVGVAARDGVVTLTGHVENYASKHAAEIAASSVKGVKAIADELEIRLPFAITRSDDEIATAAVDRLAWDVTVPRDAVKIRVENGWVTLTGEVEWHYQKDNAAKNIRPLFGVIGISDQVTIRPRVDVSHISDHIMEALHRSWFDPKTITVSADGGTVRLRGTVHSPHDRWTASEAAWAAPGTTSVENELVIV
jgi:osmotically-inducible protein OsmY